MQNAATLLPQTCSQANAVTLAAAPHLRTLIFAFHSLCHNTTILFDPCTNNFSKKVEQSHLLQILSTLVAAVGTRKEMNIINTGLLVLVLASLIISFSRAQITSDGGCGGPQQHGKQHSNDRYFDEQFCRKYTHTQTHTGSPPAAKFELSKQTGS